MQLKRRLLYLPIEVKPREFHGKLLLAAVAAARGWQVQLGRKPEVHAALEKGPHGILIELNLPEGTAGKLQRIKALGHWVANMCEESIVYYGGADYCQRKIGPTALSYADLLLVVGTDNERDLRKYRPEASGRIVVTGNPRFDVLMPAPRIVFAAEAEAIRRRYGGFLLVNTNFGPVNHVKTSSAEFLAQRLKMAKDDAHAAFLQRWHDYKHVQLAALKPLLADIAAARRYDTVVVRPHPTENHDTWRTWADPLGIKVHFEGSANSWMLAAAAMLHTGCTTAVEGALLDLPVTSFVPEPGHEMLNQADEISTQVATAAEFLAAAAPQAGGGTDPRLAAQRAKTRHIVANTEPPLAADRILDALDRLDVPEVASVARRDGLLSAAWHRAHALTRRRASYAYRKFDGLAKDEIMGPLAHWQSSGVIRRMPEMAPQADGTWVLS